MKRALVVSLYSVFLLFNAAGQENPAYQIFNKKGKAISYGKMVKSLDKADIILFGELHNDAVIHWLQLHVTKTMHASKEIILGAEMFESDDQLLMDEYLSGVISENHFTTEGKMWKNYKTDYKPLLDYAKAHDLHFVATNIPRRYASLVSRKGLQALEELQNEGKKWIAPLPIEVDLNLPGYKWMIETMGSHAPGDPKDMARSQASKDATMAHFILENFQEGKQFIHYHGTFHSNNFEGIYYYLNKGNPDLKVMTIASVSQADISSIANDNKGIADFVIVVPNDSPKTY